VKLLQQAALFVVIALVTTPVLAVHPYHGYPATRADRISRYYAAQRPWHGPYAYTPYGQPTALVVPPNVKMHTSYRGVGEVNPTPYWPSHTDQLGVGPVRGPG
jgi:hypothetical protein